MLWCKDSTVVSVQIILFIQNHIFIFIFDIRWIWCWPLGGRAPLILLQFAFFFFFSFEEWKQVSGLSGSLFWRTVSRHRCGGDECRSWRRFGSVEILRRAWASLQLQEHTWTSNPSDVAEGWGSFYHPSQQNKFFPHTKKKEIGKAVKVKVRGWLVRKDIWGIYFP